MALRWNIFTTPPFLGHREAYLPSIVSRGHRVQLLLGPAILATCAALQLLRHSATGSHSSELLRHVWAFLSKAEARDKTGKIAQYFCRFLQGALAHAPANFPLQAFKPVIAEAQTTLAWARRTHRWGKELPHIQALGEAISGGQLMDAASRAFVSLYLIQDHIYWLLKVGILKFETYTALQWHMRNLKFVLPAYVLNFALCWRDIRRIRARQRLGDSKYSGTEEALQRAEAEIYDNKRMLLRYTLTFIQIVHVSKIRTLDDWYIGIMGMVSSYIDASKQW